MPLPVKGNESVTRSWDSCLLSNSTWLSRSANLKTHSRSGLKPRTGWGLEMEHGAPRLLSGALLRPHGRAMNAFL